MTHSQIVQYVCSGYFAALVVPLVFSLIGIIAKKVIRGRASENDYFLGVDLSLATLSSAFVFFLELGKDFEKAGIKEKFMFNTAFCICNFLFLIVVVSFHQSYENHSSKVWKWILLGGLCNLIGVGLMFAFILKVKGI